MCGAHAPRHTACRAATMTRLTSSTRGGRYTARAWHARATLAPALDVFGWSYTCILHTEESTRPCSPCIAACPPRANDKAAVSRDTRARLPAELHLLILTGVRMVGTPRLALLLVT